MRRTLKWVKRIVLGLLALGVLVTLITIAALHTDWGRERVRRQIVTQLHSSFPGGVAIERLDGSVFGTLVAHRIVLRDKTGKPQVTIEKLRIQLALLPLLRKTARIDQLIAEQVVVHSREQPPEPSKPAQPPSAPSEPSDWSVEMPDVQIKTARVVIETDNGDEIIEGLEATASLRMPAGADLGAFVTARARWRGHDASVIATVEQGKTTRVPFAIVSLGAGRVVAFDVDIADGPKLSGAVAARAPAALVKALADVELPGDVDVVANGSDDHVELVGTLGTNELRVFATTDLSVPSARAIVVAQVPDLATISDGAVKGRGTAVATLTADEHEAAGLIAVAGTVKGSEGIAAHRGTPGHGGTALIAIDATRERAGILVFGRGIPDVEPPPQKDFKLRQQELIVSAWHVGGSFDLTQSNDQWTLVRSELTATATTKSPVRGTTNARFTATGPVSPALDLAIVGGIEGRKVSYNGVYLGRVKSSITARVTENRTTAIAKVETYDARRGTVMIPTATLGAHAEVGKDGVVVIDLDRHRVRTADGAIWTGAGGKITITEKQILVDTVRTGTGKSTLTASAKLSRTSEDLSAKASARDVSLAMVDPTLSGTVDADVDLGRRGGRWSGTANVDAKHVVIPKRPPIDGTLAVKVDGRRVTAHATASNPTIGAATLDFDVLGPNDLSDERGWKRVHRSSIKNIRVALTKIDARPLGLTGNLDGLFSITSAGAGGKMEARGIETSAGMLDSAFVLAPVGNGDIAARGTVQLAGLEPVEIDASFSLPEHPFDPIAWEQLGRGALKGATIEADSLRFDPAILARFGVKTTARGRLAGKIELGPAARTSTIVLDVHDLTGIGITKPVEIHVAGGTDAKGMKLDITTRADTVNVTVAAKSALTVDAAMAGAGTKTPVDIVVTVPKVAARDVALLLDRKDVLGGTLGGSVTLGGTVEKPTGRAHLAIDNLSIAGGITRKPPVLQKLELDARWYGDHGELELTAHEDGGRMLKISARGRPDSLPTVLATVEAGNFDLAPLAAFAPGQLAGARGVVGGVLKIKGLDPQQGEVKGLLHISDGRLPLSAELGTLRDAEVDIRVIKQEIVTTLDGKLGSGTVKGKAIMRLTGGMPTAAELTIALRKISPIGSVQPVISADITGWFVATRKKWTGKLAVKNGNVYVPPETGSELLGLGAPGDIIYVDAKTALAKKARRAPKNPWLTADLELGRTKLKVEDRDFLFEGIASGKLKLAVGDGGIGLDGPIIAERGALDVLGRRYRLDHGVVDFDGPLDPRLDIRFIHDFRDLTLTVDVVGRASNPDLRLSGDPGTYTQGQLLAILAGGDPGEGGSGAVVGGGLAVFSSRLGKKLTKRLPIKLDTINYEAETASSSRAIRFGARLNDKTYLLWRQRLEARPDENPGEAVLEYQLSTSWLLEGTAGQRGGGADLMWRWRR